MVTELDIALRRLVAQLRPVTGDPRRPIGLCPNTIDDGEHTRECGTRLYAPLLAIPSFAARADGNGVRTNGCVLVTFWTLGERPRVPAPEGACRLGSRSYVVPDD